MDKIKNDIVETFWKMEILAIRVYGLNIFVKI